MVLPTPQERLVAFNDFVGNIRRKAQLIHVQVHATSAFVAVNPDDGRVETYGWPNPNGFHHVMQLIGYRPIDQNLEQHTRYLQSMDRALMELDQRSDADLAFLGRRVGGLADATTAEREARGG